MENFVHLQTNNKAILNRQEFAIYEFNRLKIWIAERWPNHNYNLKHVELMKIHRRLVGSIRHLIHFNWHAENGMDEYHLCEENEVNHDSLSNQIYDETQDEYFGVEEESDDEE